MSTLVGWLAVGAVLFFIYFVTSRVIKLVIRTKRSSEPIHDELADAAEDIAGASRVVAALAGAVAFFVAPAGLLAIGAALGIVSVPLIVKLVPMLAVFAVGAAALSALAKLYAKSKRRK